MANGLFKEIIKNLRTLEKWRNDKPVSDEDYVSAIQLAYQNNLYISYERVRVILKIGVYAV